MSGQPLSELFADQDIDLAAAGARLQRVAAELGLPYIPRDRTYNSRRAQELCKWAESLGRGEAFHHAAFRALFAEGLNISEISVLEGVAASVGLPAAEVAEVLNQGLFRSAVDEDWAYSQERRIRAVPTFRAGGRVAVGAQPYEELEKLVLRAGAVPR